MSSFNFRFSLLSAILVLAVWALFYCSVNVEAHNPDDFDAEDDEAVDTGAPMPQEDPTAAEDTDLWAEEFEGAASVPSVKTPKAPDDVAKETKKPKTKADYREQRYSSMFGPFLRVVDRIDEAVGTAADIVGGALLILAIVVYFRGDRTHRSRMESLFTEFAAVATRQFRSVKMAPDEGRRSTVLRDGPCFYMFYASGRANCQGLIVSSVLASRTNLFYYLSLSQRTDVIHIEAQLPPGTPPLTLLCASQKDALEEAKGRQPAVELFNCSTQKLPFPLTCLAESPMLSERLLDKNVIECLTSNIELFHSLYIGDKGVRHLYHLDHFDSSSDKEKALQEKCVPLISIRMYWSHAKDKAGLGTFMELCLYLVDMVARLQLSANTLSKHLETRGKYETKNDEEASAATGIKKGGDKKKKQTLLEQD